MIWSLKNTALLGAPQRTFSNVVLRVILREQQFLTNGFIKYKMAKANLIAPAPSGQACTITILEAVFDAHQRAYAEQNLRT